MRKTDSDSSSLAYQFEEIDEGKLLALEEMVASGLLSPSLETYYKVGGVLYKTLKEAREDNSRGVVFKTIYKTMVLTLQTPGKPEPMCVIPVKSLEIITTKREQEEEKRKSILSKLSREEIEFLRIGQD